VLPRDVDAVEHDLVVTPWLRRGLDGDRTGAQRRVDHAAADRRDAAARPDSNLPRCDVGALDGPTVAPDRDVGEEIRVTAFVATRAVENDCFVRMPGA